MLVVNSFSGTFFDLILYKEKRFSSGHLCILSLEIILYWITLLFYSFWT